MSISRNGRDPRNSEIERGDVVTQALAPRQQPTAKAAVNVQSNVVLQRQLTQLGDGVDEPVGIVAGRAHQGHRVGGDVLGHPIHIHQPVVGQRSVQHLDAEIVTGLVEGHMGGDGQDHLGGGDALFDPAPLSIHQHGVDETFGAAGGDHAADLLGTLTVEHVSRHGDDLALHLGGTGIHVALQHIGVGIQSIDLGEEVVVVVTSVVHRPGQLA